MCGDGQEHQDTGQQILQYQTTTVLPEIKITSLQYNIYNVWWRTGTSRRSEQYNISIMCGDGQEPVDGANYITFIMCGDGQEPVDVANNITFL